MRRPRSTAAVAAVVLAILLSKGVATASGGFDPSYGDDGIATVVMTSAGGVHPIVSVDGSRLVGLAGAPARLYRAFTDGEIDSTFGSGGFVDLPPLSFGYQWSGLAVQPDQRILIGSVSASGAWVVRRYAPDGTVDATFGAAGEAEIDPSPIFEDTPAIRVMDDGRILLASRAGFDAGIARLNPDGSPDLTFGTGGIVITDYGSLGEYYFDPTVQPDGKILVSLLSGFGSPEGAFAMARFNDDGSPDTEFGAGSGYVRVPGMGANTTDIALLPDGKILMTGIVPYDIASRYFEVLRFLPDGSLDPSFGTGGVVTHDFVVGDSDESLSLTLQPGGRFLVVGQATTPTASEQVAAARFEADGTLDTSFGDGGLAVALVDNFSQPLSVVPLPDGDVLVSGSSFPMGGVRNFYLRLTMCGPCDVALADGSCATAPPLGCIGTTTPGSSKLLVRAGVTDDRDVVSWQWRRGGATGGADFGDPMAGDALRFCLYTGSETSPMPLMRALLPGGLDASGSPLWSKHGDAINVQRWKFKDKTGSHDGMTAAALKSGPAGKAGIKLKGLGARLDPPTLPLALPVRARLQASTGACWEAELSTARRNTTSIARAVGE